MVQSAPHSNEEDLKWISWKDHPVPNDVKGIIIKYYHGVFSDRYDINTGKRKYNGIPMAWKFMDRKDPDSKSIQCSQDLFGMRATE